MGDYHTRRTRSEEGLVRKEEFNMDRHVNYYPWSRNKVSFTHIELSFAALRHSTAMCLAPAAQMKSELEDP
jgi:hypothetical protein